MHAPATRRTLLKAGAGITLAVAGGGFTPAFAQDGPWQITLLQGVKADNFYISMACGAQQAADESGAELDGPGPGQVRRAPCRRRCSRRSSNRSRTRS